jgi:hypothetical protein
VYGHHICCQRCYVVVSIEEGVAPFGCVTLDYGPEPASLQVVEVVIALLVGKYLVAILGVAPCKRAVSIALLGIVALHKVHAAAVYTVAMLYDALHLVALVVGIVESALYLVHIIRYLHIYIGQHTTCVLVVDKHLGMTVLGIQRSKGLLCIGKQIVAHTSQH